MCGFVGFYSIHHYPNLSLNLQRAADTLTHRGPDDFGQYIDRENRAGLAHRRLSVIDLSPTGAQPMESDDGQVIIVYNGEVYNFIELRQQLKRLGYKFKSQTDTEVILNAYREWGINCFERLNGMFAFVIWDRRYQKMVLVRDRLGIKPLYYGIHDDKLFFASELKALMAFSDFEKNINLEAISLFLHYQYIPAPYTVFKNTFKLLPGNYLTYPDHHAAMRPFWKLPEMANETKPSKMDIEEKVHGLDTLLTRTVSEYLISDVPLGALLSGGIDSSLVVAMMQKVSASPVKTFSMGFKEKAYNEAGWARKVAAYLGTDHTEFCLLPKDALKIIPGLPEIYDEPFADASAIPSVLINQLARSQVTVALSGDGGDEQFAGYVRYWSTSEVYRIFQYLPKLFRSAMYRLFKSIPTDRIEKVYSNFIPILPKRFHVNRFPEKWNKIVELFSEVKLSELYRTTVCLWSKEAISMLFLRPLINGQFEEAFEATEEWPILSRLMHVDQKTYLPDAMLTKVDRASMAASLEIRVPLLDHRIVEFTSSLPNSMKYHNGTGKFLLKKVLAQYLPMELFDRPKMGFGVPIEQWFRNELKELLLDYLSLNRLKKEGLFNYRQIEENIEEHLSGKINHTYRLWALLMWEMWRDKWIN